MKKQIKTMEQLRDSSLLFETELPKFGYMILLIITFSIVGVIAWSTNAKKLYTIISQGTVTSSASNYVMPAYTGEIEQCYMEEGMLVQEGDILFGNSVSRKFHKRSRIADFIH